MKPKQLAPETTAPSRSVLLGLLVGLCVLVAFVIALFGAWVGTTLAIYNDGPVWLAIVGAIFCFALLPLGWELTVDRDQVGGRARDAILRSAFLSLAFVAVLVATHPKMAFEALATRGDWFLGGSKSATAESIRGVLHTAANGLEWLNDLVREKAFRLDEDDPDQIASDSAQPTPQPSSEPVVVSTLPSQPATESVPYVPQSRDGPSLKPAPEDTKGTVTAFKIAGTDLTWPLPAEIHPAVRDMPDDAKKSIAAVGKYLKEAVDDPLMRVKAIHDFVAMWVAYDAVGLADGSYKRTSQEAKAVFDRRSGVCAGYSKLMAGIARVTGDEIVYVGGDARGSADYSELAYGSAPPAAKGIGHAWNAAKIGDHWYLIDATWDAGFVNGTTFSPKYRTSYLFIPPEIMIIDHLPDAKRFQLLPVALDRASWMRQHFAEPLLFMLGLSVLEPTGPLTAATGTFTLRVENPHRNHIWLQMVAPGSTDHAECERPTNDHPATMTCTIASEGRGRAILFASTERYSAYKSVLEVIVDGKP